MSGKVIVDVDMMRVEYDNGEVICFNGDGWHALCKCGMCGKPIGYIHGFSFDKNLTRAIARNTMFDGAYVCDDCYDKIKAMRKE